MKEEVENSYSDVYIYSSGFGILFKKRWIVQAKFAFLTVRKLAANKKVKSCSLQSLIWTPYNIARDTNFIPFESIMLVDYDDVVRSVKILYDE